MARFFCKLLLSSREGRKSLLQRAVTDLVWELSFFAEQLGLVESKMAIEGRQMIMMLGPNKTVIAKQQSAEKSSEKSKSKAQGQDNGKPSVTEAPKEPEAQEESKTPAPVMVDT